ncbi:unnamed protein product [Schistocephalus solidus]|uniref:Tropomyosin n=1 Tax=Schistocephalus solidus TaxID=70667 RepID=A0A183SUW7_SCHSO|nr:unnamed protein product [Schistocephalus solidus]
MEAIKKKMLVMKLDKENAVDLADQLEEKLKEKEMEMMKKEEEIGEISKRLTALEAEKESSESQLTETNQKLEDTEKRATERRYSVDSVRTRRRNYRAAPSDSTRGPRYCDDRADCSIQLRYANFPSRVHPPDSLRMSVSFIDFPSSTSHIGACSSCYCGSAPGYTDRQRRHRRPRQHRNSRPTRHTQQPLCDCPHCYPPSMNVMCNSLYDFAPLGIRPDPEGATVSGYNREKEPQTTAFAAAATKAEEKPYNFFSNEPLFSDYGDNSDGEDKYIEARKRQQIKDPRTAFAEAFSASTLNSGTLIKLAIIGAELKNIVQTSIDKAEAEVAALQRRIRLLEDELESTDTRLTDATVKLEEASKAADESERFRRALQSRQVSDDDRIEQLTVMIQRTTKEAAEAKAKFEEVKGGIYFSVYRHLPPSWLWCGCKVLENRTVADEERISQLEEQLKEFTFMAEDADRKYDEASRKLAITEVDLERAESRLEASERKIVDLEEELRIVGNNMKSLEISEQEVKFNAAQREEAYEENIRDLTERLKDASKQKEVHQATLEKLKKQLAESEARAQESERLVHSLQSEVDRLEGKENRLADKNETVGLPTPTYAHPLRFFGYCLVDAATADCAIAIAEARAKTAEGDILKKQSQLSKLEDQGGGEIDYLVQVAQDHDNYDYRKIPDVCSSSIDRALIAIDRAYQIQSIQSNNCVTISFSLTPTKDELVAEKEKYKALSEELESTFAELTGN